MAFSDLAQHQDVVSLLQRSLERGRLGHAYLFVGASLPRMETVARTLAKTLNCEQPPRRGAAGQPVDCCDACPSCRRTEADTHPDVLWIRPVSKLRQIRLHQIVQRPESSRPLLPVIYLKPTAGRYKVGIITSADRMSEEAANSLLKGLEEPPANSVFLLLSTDPDRLPETILSRCLRLHFAGDTGPAREPEVLDWLQRFSELAVRERGTLLSRYRLLSALLARLETLRGQIQQDLGASSPLERYADQEPDPDLRDKWEQELAAAIEAEYRRRRAELLDALHWWLRDVWLATLGQAQDQFSFPQCAPAVAAVAARLAPDQALANLRVLEQTQRLLFTNVQEALALEVGLLQLHL